MKFQTIPQWAKPQTPDAIALFEVFALLGIEGQWVRLSADDQRAIFGANVFGRQEMRIDADGTLTVRRSVCFGTCKEAADYTVAQIQRCVKEGWKLSPGTYGAGYANLGADGKASDER